MAIAASRIFDFLERQEAGTVERHEISLAAFGALRRSLRQIVLRLRDSDDQDALSLSGQLRALLSEWLTIPVAFECSMLDAVSGFFRRSEAGGTRWGSDIQALYDEAIRATENLRSVENPVRDEIRLVIWELRAQAQTFKVYCHRRARPHFETIFIVPGELPLSEDTFLHSVQDYRNTEPFDTLIKVGPLRARGWGSAPDALLTAPRFRTLVQVVWSGCSDEPGFGYDPALPPTDNTATDGATPPVAVSIGRRPVQWKTLVTRSGEDPGAAAGYTPEEDELRAFREMDQSRDERRATLFEIAGKHGILYPPHSEVLSFDPASSACEPIDYRRPGESLHEGLYIILPRLGEVDLGGVRAEHGHYSRIWKARLEQQWRTDASGLIKRLQAAGLNLVYLGAAIKHWCEPPSTVIHAPQTMKHFEILVRVLGVGSDAEVPQHLRWGSWSQFAWVEIARSRGEAIQTGFEEQGIVDEQSLLSLRRLIAIIRAEALAKADFLLPIPDGNGIRGEFAFFKVYRVEEGFRAPEAELKVVRELSVIDKWRD